MALVYRERYGLLRDTDTVLVRRQSSLYQRLGKDPEALRITRRLLSVRHNAMEGQEERVGE